MGRKSKSEELRKWTKELKPFVFSLYGEGIDQLITVLARTEVEAKIYVRTQYHTLNSFILNKPNSLHIL